ncbi:hypothetical protein Glove_184g41 [Diversispora epigaea]|uniref:Uncharacterized protein n=1 Tax=Diversispora epigaea TaxID=1348612 RepID=A0A397IMK7_9GLOM|nr:hypothetical protein Glove_184g41 [Diversispora epigaea]
MTDESTIHNAIPQNGKEKHHSWKKKIIQLSPGSYVRVEDVFEEQPVWQARTRSFCHSAFIYCNGDCCYPGEHCGSDGHCYPITFSTTRTLLITQTPTSTFIFSGRLATHLVLS